MFGTSAGFQAETMWRRLSGLRWIPSYRIDTDGSGKASVKLQASLMNDLVDLKDTLIHLVVGVPNFRFHDVKDPISLNAVAQQTAAVGRRTPGFRGDSRNRLSNMITTQVAGAYEPGGGSTIMSYTARCDQVEATVKAARAFTACELRR